MNLKMRQFIFALTLITVAAPSFARSSENKNKPVTKTAASKTVVKSKVKAPEKHVVKTQPKVAPKVVVMASADKHKRIVEINLSDAKVKNSRAPASVNGKTVTYVPEQKSVPKQVVTVDKYANGVDDSSYDAIMDMMPRKHVYASQDPKMTRINASAEIDSATLQEASTASSASPPNALAAQTPADASSLKHLKKSAEKEIQEDYY
jgi:hypothetical protein